MKRDTFTKYIENHVSMNDMKAFVCEDKDDVITFLSHVRDEQKLAVNAIAMPAQASASFVPPKPISDYAYVLKAHLWCSLFIPWSENCVCCSVRQCFETKFDTAKFRVNLHIIQTRIALQSIARLSFN